MKRNTKKFPEDFCFELGAEEVATLKSQNATSSVTGYGGRTTVPFAFAEHALLLRAITSQGHDAPPLILARRHYSNPESPRNRYLCQRESKHSPQLSLVTLTELVIFQYIPKPRSHPRQSLSGSMMDTATR